MRGKNEIRNDRDLKFLLFEHLRVDRQLDYAAYRDFSAEDFSVIVDEALKVGREVLEPATRDGDRRGCAYKDGEVVIPDSFHECWRVMADNGWLAPTSNTQFGGQGLPAVVGGIVNEIFCGANLAMFFYTGLAVTCAHLIESFGTDEDRAVYVKRMYTGRWSGTMCLTEPDSGSDVGYIKTRAVPDPAGGDERIYRISGNKRFISCGQHGLTENIIHSVLARIEGAPHGTKGLSLFIVPKYRVEPDGSPGRPNDVFCAGIESKMGLHASPTCSINFGENGDCRGILLGKPNSGMAMMFQAMNEARTWCGLHALGLAGSAYNTALAYAKDRLQGPLFTDHRSGRVPIIRHEDVRRMLMNIKAGTEAMRAMIGYTYYLMDEAKHDPDPAARQQAQQLADLFTPLVKAYCSDYGFNLVCDAMQIMGGVGYCTDFPIEQYLREAKLVSLVEGINYIQAQDLVGRKLGPAGGEVFQRWLNTVLEYAHRHKQDQAFGPDFAMLTKAARATGDYAARFMDYFKSGRTRMVPLSATRFLACAAEVLMGRLILEQGLIARRRLDRTETGKADRLFYQGKMETARFFCRNVLPNVLARHEALRQEDASALDMPETAF